MSEAITLQDTVVRKDALVSSNLSPTETVMLDIDKGSYYGMQDVARVIWDLLVEPMTVADLCGKLQEQFEVDAETCRKEVLEFLKDLVEEGLVDVQDTSSST